MKYGLSENTVIGILEVLSEYPQIEQVILYGSRAMGNYRSGSDIDLCIVGNQIDLTLLFEIERALDDLNLPYKIDLAARHLINNSQLLHIIGVNGVQIYQKDLAIKQ